MVFGTLPFEILGETINDLWTIFGSDASFRELFTTVIQEADVEYYHDGSQKIKYSPYCLHHTYATFRLRYTDVPLLALARNMGTSIAMIEEYYADVVPQHYVAKLL